MFFRNFLYSCALFLFLNCQIFAENIGLLIMATGKYIEFVHPLIDSADQHFCPGHKVTYFVFTDSDDERLKEKENVVLIYQRRLGWPYDRIMRFKTYFKNRDFYEGQDYLFACDASMFFVSDMGDEILGDQVGVIDPRFYNKPRMRFSYETNPNSLAYIKQKEGKHYFTSKFFGGSHDRFLDIAGCNAERIDSDLNHKIVALCYDESHWNRYCVDHLPSIILSPSYSYPEKWEIPFSPKLISLEKDSRNMRSL